MSNLQIENIIKGIASGQYVQKVGSQFGSIWGFDGLLAVEATPAQYAALVDAKVFPPEETMKDGGRGKTSRKANP